MNERIKELAEQCFFTKDKYGLYWDENANADGVDLEKFAELIVRECVSLFDGSEELKTVGLLSHKQIVDKIEEHFRS